MIRNLNYRFEIPVERLEEAQAKMVQLLTARARIRIGILGFAASVERHVTEEFDRRELWLRIRMEGYDEWRVKSRGEAEVELLARNLRLGPGSVVLVSCEPERSMQELTKDEGRHWRPSNRVERAAKRRARWEEFLRSQASGAHTDPS